MTPSEKLRMKIEDILSVPIRENVVRVPDKKTIDAILQAVMESLPDEELPYRDYLGNRVQYYEIGKTYIKDNMADGWNSYRQKVMELLKEPKDA